MSFGIPPHPVHYVLIPFFLRHFSISEWPLCSPCFLIYGPGLRVCNVRRYLRESSLLSLTPSISVSQRERLNVYGCGYSGLYLLVRLMAQDDTRIDSFSNKAHTVWCLQYPAAPPLGGGFIKYPMNLRRSRRRRAAERWKMDKRKVSMGHFWLIDAFTLFWLIIMLYDPKN